MLRGIAYITLPMLINLLAYWLVVTTIGMQSILFHGLLGFAIGVIVTSVMMYFDLNRPSV